VAVYPLSVNTTNNTSNNLILFASAYLKRQQKAEPLRACAFFTFSGLAFCCFVGLNAGGNGFLFSIAIARTSRHYAHPKPNQIKGESKIIKGMQLTT